MNRQVPIKPPTIEILHERVAHFRCFDSDALCYNRAAAVPAVNERAAATTWLEVGVETLAKRFHVSGMVQGVGFRFFAEDAARRAGVAGYVRNLPDGGVEVYAIGSTGQLEALRNELQRGPRMARVERVTAQDAEVLAQFAGGFSIERF